MRILINFLDYETKYKDPLYNIGGIILFVRRLLEFIKNRMKVLFFAGTQLSPKVPLNSYGGMGWMSALQSELKLLGVNMGFTYLHTEDNWFKHDGVSYYCVKAPHKKITTKIRNGLTPRNLRYDMNRDEIIMKKFQKVVEDYKPDIIHVFGSETCYGLITKYTNLPVVIHLQGIINVYWNAYLVPGVSLLSYCLNTLNPKKMWTRYQQYWEWYRICAREREILQNCKYFIGRTAWDKGCINTLTNKYRYFYGGEILRSEFYNTPERLQPEKLTIVTTSSAAIYKGYDMILKTAKVLKEKIGDNFTWKVYGNVDKTFYESYLAITHENVNVELCGVATPGQLADTLSRSSLYFHPSYIENSPNSICEAQIVGCPIVACFIGGNESLIKHGVEGFLVPANDPYMAASRIIQLYNDRELNKEMGNASKIIARKRHDKETIVTGLIDIYKEIISIEKNE